MFWKFDLHNSSQVEKLLEKEDVTLQELLDEEDVLQECKAQNQRLLLFLTRDSSMLELLNLITHEPPTDREEKLRYKWVERWSGLSTLSEHLLNKWEIMKQADLQMYKHFTNDKLSGSLNN